MYWLSQSIGSPKRKILGRHESLIAVSNKEFYGNSLVVFPSPDSEREELGLRFNHFPDAVYDRGSSRTNREEAGEVGHTGVKRRGG